MLTKISMSRGFSLVEVIVAVLIITLGVGAAFALAQRVTSTAGIVNDQLVASYLAQEGLEIVRNIRESNYVAIYNGTSPDWDAGFDDSDCRDAAGCEADYNDHVLVDSADQFLNVDAAGRYSYEAGTPTPFKRKIVVNPVDLGGGEEKVEVAVEVWWAERGRTHRVEAATELYDWLNL